MVNSDSDVQTRHFSKDDYDGAKSYQLEQASDVQYSEETESDSSAKTAAKLKKSKRQKGCRTAALLLSLFDNLKPMQSGFFGSGYGVKPHIYRSGCGARSPANIINQ